MPNSNLFSNRNNINTISQSCFPYSFFSVSDIDKDGDKNQKKILILNENEPSHRRLGSDSESFFSDNVQYIGSSHGWVGCMNPCSRKIFLFNPLSPADSIILLPPPPEFPSDISCNRPCWQSKLSPPSPLLLDPIVPSPNFVVRKLILSSPPTDPDCRVLAVDRAGFMWFCVPGDPAWTLLDTEGPNVLGNTDVVYSNRDKSFYVRYSNLGQSTGEVLVAWDLSDPKSPEWHFIIYGGEWICGGEFTDGKFYLVESSQKDILLVHSYFDQANEFSPQEMLLRFVVYHNDPNDDRDEWSFFYYDIDDALILGKNHSFSVPPSDFPVEAKSIYYTESEFWGHSDCHGRCDMGVYNLEKDILDPDPSAHQIYYFRDSEQKKTRQTPIWVLPDPSSSMEALVETVVTTTSSY